MLISIWQNLTIFFKSPLIYSWQTVLKLSIISYIIAIIAKLISDSNTSLVSNFISICGSLFLVIAFSWATIEYQIFFSNIKPKTPIFEKLIIILWQFIINFRPWCISGLICILFTINFGIQILPLSLVIWTPLAGLISIISEFTTPDLHWKSPTLQQRSQIIILLGFQVLVSCWIQIYLMVNSELQQYPTILADDFSKNHFVIKSPYSEPVEPLGGLFVDIIASQYSQQLNKRPWSEIVVLMKNMWQNPPTNFELQQIIVVNQKDKKDQEKQVKIRNEASLWEISVKVEIIDSDYNLIVKALWKGAKANLEESYSIEKNCKISPIFPDPNDSQAAISQIECQSTKMQGWN